MTSATAPVPSVHVPRLQTRASMGWVIGGFLATCATVGYLGVTQPENRWAAVVLLVLLLAGSLLWPGRGHWIEPLPGGFVWQRFFVVQKRVGVTDVGQVRIVSSRLGTVVLGVRERHGRERFLPLMLRTAYVRGCQRPDVLRALAELVARTDADRSGVAARLRDQADHVAAGGGLDTSPLARRRSP